MEEKNELELYIEKIAKRHIPAKYLETECIKELIGIFVKKTEFERNEIIVLAYLFGADSEETDEILKLVGFEPLYAKNWDDAIWRFFIRKRVDLMSINSYMLQCDE